MAETANHIYARSHPLDASGKPVTTGKGAVRYFVTGGGGAPLYDIAGEDPRFAKALTQPDFHYDDSLPPRCAPSG